MSLAVCRQPERRQQTWKAEYVVGMLIRQEAAGRAFGSQRMPCTRNEEADRFLD